MVPMEMDEQQHHPVFWIARRIVVDQEYHAVMGRGLFLVYFITMVFLFLCTLMEGAMIRAILDLYAKKEPLWRECLEGGYQRSGTLFRASVAVTMGVMDGLVHWFIPGIYFSVHWYCVLPVLLVEGGGGGKQQQGGMGVRASLKRSWNLVATTGSRWRVFGVMAIYYTSVAILNLLWNLLLIPPSIFSLVPILISGPIGAILMTITYLDLRMEQEGLNESELIHKIMDDLAALDDASDMNTPLLLEDEEKALDVQKSNRRITAQSEMKMCCCL